jgi:translation initiation factor IF-2
LEAEQWANEKQFTMIFTSAKTGENVDVLIDQIARRFLSPARQEPMSEPASLEDLKQTRPCC